VNIVHVDYPDQAGPFSLRALSSITDFIVHHSAGPTSQTPLEIDAFERSRGDIYIPYTWLIGADGTVYDGRPITAISAASYGRNAQSVAVCVIGNFQENDAGYTGPPSDAQLNSLLSLCIYAHRTIPMIVRTYAHGDIAMMFYPQDPGDYSTACCGSVLRAKLPDIKSKVAQALHH
jgi:hypothetical protein